jgi:glycosyltransferase involved in cell wall biosynthesis
MIANAPEVSAIVVCFNEEDNIGRCLESLRWCDEIVVVDAFSTDRTVEICRRYTDRVIQRAWTGYRDQKAYAHSQATKPWVFLVDSDEEVSAALRAEIRTALLSGDGLSAFSIPRLVRYLGRWWWRGGWYPDYDIRIFRRELARWGGTDPHEKIIVAGKVRRLRNPLYHYSYRDVADHWKRVNHFTSVSAAEQRGSRQAMALDGQPAAPAVSFFALLRFEARLDRRFSRLFCRRDGGDVRVSQVREAPRTRAEAAGRAGQWAALEDR